VAEPRQPVSNPNALRDHLANERTLLAWLRTSVAMIGLGFVVAKFGLLLHELGGRNVHRLTQTAGNVVGVLLVLGGAIAVGLAIANFERVRRGINRNEVAFSPLLAITTGAIVIVVGLFLTIYLLITA
jgi:putative membrane protein